MRVVCGGDIEGIHTISIKEKVLWFDVSVSHTP